MSIESIFPQNKKAPSRQRDLFDDCPTPAEAHPRLITDGDMPSYRRELVALVEQSLSQVPAQEVWFTYRDIGKYFGISKATIARRLQDGLVPGVTLVGNQVQVDGNVRRFDRAQLRWLLLAVRFGRTLGANTEPQTNRSS